VGCALAFAPLASPSSLARLDAAGAGVLAFCALNTVVGYGAFAESLAHWEASRVGAVLALTPLGTLACRAALDARGSRGRRRRSCRRAAGSARCSSCRDRSPPRSAPSAGARVRATATASARD
jgi:hypothetical protein